MIGFTQNGNGRSMVVQCVRVEGVERGESGHAFGHGSELHRPAPQLVFAADHALEARGGQIALRGQDRHEHAGREIPVRDDRVDRTVEGVEFLAGTPEQVVEIELVGRHQSVVVE
ncbi:hypothetical protein [Nocardia cyriacigeorgica]|uniref:hypothetical protein n=1 Tax=Nocardia cyriacigeorgica TaxID=135487 RepID=UPI0034DB4C3D